MYECSTNCGRGPAGCGEKFRSLAGFDTHLHGDARDCRSVAWLFARGFVRDDAGTWIDPRSAARKELSTPGGTNLSDVEAVAAP